MKTFDDFLAEQKKKDSQNGASNEIETKKVSTYHKANKTTQKQSVQESEGTTVNSSDPSLNSTPQKKQTPPKDPVLELVSKFEAKNKKQIESQAQKQQEIRNIAKAERLGLFAPINEQKVKSILGFGAKYLGGQKIGETLAKGVAHVPLIGDAIAGKERAEQLRQKDADIVGTGLDVALSLPIVGQGARALSLAKKAGRSLAGEKIARLGGIVTDKVPNLIKNASFGAGFGAGEVRRANENAALDDIVISGAIGGSLGLAFPLAAKAAKYTSNKIKFNKKSTSGKMDFYIDKYFEKAIVPQFRGANKTPQQRSKYKTKSQVAIKAIIDSKESVKLLDEAGDRLNNKLPESLQQFEQALTQTKEKIFKEYDMIAQKAGNVKVQTQNIIDDLRAFAKDRKYALYPEAHIKAIKKAELLEELGDLSPSEAQEQLKILNKSLKTFYNQSGQDANEAMINHIIANNLRKNIDEAVENLEGKQYRELKSIYGALSSIEKDVTHRALVEGRKAPNGFYDITDIYSAAELASGVGGNMAGFVKGTAAITTKNILKLANDKNRMIKKMFNKVDALNTKP